MNTFLNKTIHHLIDTQVTWSFADVGWLTCNGYGVLVMYGGEYFIRNENHSSFVNFTEKNVWDVFGNHICLHGEEHKEE